MFEEYRRLFDLQGKVALVTGGGGGIGRSVCEGLAAFGAQVVVAGKTLSKAETVAAAIGQAGGTAWAGELDLTDTARVREFVGQVGERSGGVDILVNCVGVHMEAPALEYSEELWDRVFETNLRGAFFLSQAVARVQIASGRGRRHIHLSSVRSLLGLHRGYASYCASKGGLNLMIRQLATEWAGHGITVNGIAPTFTRTGMARTYLEDPGFYNPLIARIPLGRICEPIDLAGLTIYLASPAADFITGQIIFADGGLTACQ